MKYNKNIITFMLYVSISSAMSPNAETPTLNNWGLQKTVDALSKASNIVTNGAQYFTKKLNEFVSKDALALAGLISAGLLGTLFYYNKQQKAQQLALVKTNTYQNEYWKIIADKMKNENLSVDNIPMELKELIKKVDDNKSLTPEEKTRKNNALYEILLIYHAGSELVKKLMEKGISKENATKKEIFPSSSDRSITIQ